jgi:hypothetical protein
MAEAPASALRSAFEPAGFTGVVRRSPPRPAVLLQTVLRDPFGRGPGEIVAEPPVLDQASLLSFS